MIGGHQCCCFLVPYFEHRCPPGKALVHFMMPVNEVTARGDVRISIQSVGVRTEEMGWIHLHTTWLPPNAGPSTLEGARLVPRGVKLLSAEFPKEEVDEANKDARFAADWRLILHYFVAK